VGVDLDARHGAGRGREGVAALREGRAHQDDAVAEGIVLVRHDAGPRQLDERLARKRGEGAGRPGEVDAPRAGAELRHVRLRAAQAGLLAHRQGDVAVGRGQSAGEVGRRQPARRGERGQREGGKPAAARGGQNRREAADHAVGADRRVGEAAQAGHLRGEGVQQRVALLPLLAHRHREGGEEQRTRTRDAPARDRVDQRLVLGGRGGGGQHEVEGHHPGPAPEQEVGEVGDVAPRQRLALPQRLEGIVVDGDQGDFGGGDSVAQEQEGVHRPGLPPREHAGAGQRGDRQRDEQADQHRARHPRASARAEQPPDHRPTPVKPATTEAARGRRIIHRRAACRFMMTPGRS
jgi:hypothetical protein